MAVINLVILAIGRTESVLTPLRILPSLSATTHAWAVTFGKVSAASP
jgi:hypothetical protein